MRHWFSGPLRVVFLAACLSAVSTIFLTAPTAYASSTARFDFPRESPAKVKDQSFWSGALDREMRYKVYLPAGYDSSPTQRYPVLYMLHGLGGNGDQWGRDGLFATASDLIQRGVIPPMIIVTPEGNRGYWMDHANKGPRFGTYVSRDLVGMVDFRYRTIATREARAIGGMSMGGHGALQLALNHPDKFGVIGAHSVALRRQEQAFDFFGDKQSFEARDPVSLCRKNQETAKQFKIWIDIGVQDQWYKAAEAFHQQLQSQSISHSWNVYSGGHDDGYWRIHAKDYLSFYGLAFSSPNPA